MKKVRWGVIGAGGIAQRRTIPGMMQCENAELVAVMEITPELAESCRAKWNCKKAYTSAEDLLNDPEIDAVYIASPVFLHAQQAMAAADAGKHILIEKPLAMTAAEGQKVVEHCKEKGVLIAAGFMMRFGACIQAMKKAIAEGKIGKPVSAYAQFTCWYPDIPGAWRQKKTQGGGGAILRFAVQLARGNFQHHAAYRGAVLVNHGNISVLVHRHDSHRANVTRDFAQCRAAVGQAHLPVLYMQKRAVEYLFAAQLVLDHILSIHY